VAVAERERIVGIVKDRINRASEWDDKKIAAFVQVEYGYLLAAIREADDA
jgi:hypothetical protein